MDFNEAVRKSVKKFLSGKMDMTEVSTVSKSEIVYTYVSLTTLRKK
mgnify:CR=1 FL=1